MDQNKTTKLFSWAGVLIILLIVVLLNFILGLSPFRSRIDLTADKLYTLSKGTENIVKNLDTKVNIRYYRTEDRSVLPEQVQVYIRRVEDILNEYRKRSKGKVEVELLDPEPDSKEEVAALQDGIQRNSINLVESFYNGIVVQCLDEKVVLSTLDPNQETLLEYELSRAVAEVSRSSKPKIAIMTDEPINGGPGNPMNPMGGGGSRPWYLNRALERDYEVETIPSPPTRSTRTWISYWSSTPNRSANVPSTQSTNSFYAGASSSLSWTPVSTLAKASRTP